MRAQADAFIARANAQDLPVKMLLRDRDCKYAPVFDNPIRAAGAKVRVVGRRAPNMNAYIERFVQAIGQECLDKFIAFGQNHLDHLVREYVEHYHTERPHQGKENVPLAAGPPAGATDGNGEVRCRERL